MQCSSCGFENPEGMKFCGECATPLKRRCPQCGVENPPGFKFCGECGTPLAGQVPSSQFRFTVPSPQQLSVLVVSSQFPTPRYLHPGSSG